MILVDHKLKTNAIKTQQTHIQTKQQSRGNKTSKTVPQFESICQGKRVEKRDEKSDEKNLYIYCIFIEMQKTTKWKRDSSLQFWPRKKCSADSQLSRVSSSMASSQLGFDFGLTWLGLGFLLWGLRIAVWVLGFGFGSAVALNCLCLASIFGGSSASFGAVTNSARRSWPRVLNA